MYSDKENINILTALLIAHGVRHAVVCPGSRNAPIVHNLAQCPELTCYPVSDERSAAFCAMGIAMRTALPTVVCVTSGTALLNTVPAVAEAFYQRVPLVVISADRPQQWIDQLDGQTLPQLQALDRFVRKSVTLPEVHSGDSEGHWYCNRLVNEALLASVACGGSPVHINVPISRPLYNFSCPSLPAERGMTRITATGTDITPMLHDLHNAERPVIVIGQQHKGEVPEDIIDKLNSRRYVVLQEPLGGARGGCLDAMLPVKGNGFPTPDFILYAGRTLVSGTIKEYLRNAEDARCWRIDDTGDITDTFMNLTGVIAAPTAEVLRAIDGHGDGRWYDRWQQLRKHATEHIRSYNPPFSSLLAVKSFEERLSAKDPTATVFYGNSMAVRIGCVYALHHIECNRGVNGIEGSMSTAAGSSLVSTGNVYCVIGDLSFFYDRNALWNSRLRGNLRILLLNNGGGAIFEKFSRLTDDNDIRNVKATYRTSARGVCSDNGADYRVAADREQLSDGLRWLTDDVSDRPRVLEVETDAATDWMSYQQCIANNI